MISSTASKGIDIMNKFKISSRLCFLVAFSSLLMLIVGGIGLHGIKQTNEAFLDSYENGTMGVANISEISRLNLRSRLAIESGMLFPEETLKDVAEVESHIAAVEKLWAEYLTTSLSPQETAIAEKLSGDLTRFTNEGLKPALVALRGNDLVAAKKLVTDRIRPLNAPLRDDIDALIKVQMESAKANYDESVANFESVLLLSVLSIVLGIVFAVSWGTVLVRSLSRSLLVVSGAAESAAQGDLTQMVVVEGKDEISLVLGAIAEMQSNLIQTVSMVRDGAEGVATASEQIASGNNDLSARTESQASALQQTAASMEQLSATVQQNAENARTANALAMTASTVASQGGAVVAQVVDTMRHINESSRKIEDIIGVIDGIAFQTNILALNAAVEAARAGDHGRGFAVVATEVRSLAGRSAEAAKEIKSLIGASVAQVAQGTALVDRAGATMTEVVNSIERVTALVGEISIASGEQAAGVQQVGEAVMQMDEVTQQNAALVEEMAAAASSLTQQARDLLMSISVFKYRGRNGKVLGDDSTEPVAEATVTTLVSQRPVRLVPRPAFA
jgi:methyl-accepting chemotaxis protein